MKYFDSFSFVKTITFIFLVLLLMLPVVGGVVALLFIEQERIKLKHPKWTHKRIIIKEVRS